MDPEELGAMIQSGRKRLLFELAAAPKAHIGRHEIERLLPHRDPFLFLDRIVAVDLPNCAVVGARRIAEEDPVFCGHFPDGPVYPGVLQLEMLGQAGLCLLGLLENAVPRRAQEKCARRVRMLKIHHAVFLLEVRPGDELLLPVRILYSDDFTGICAGQIVRGNSICAFVVMEVYFVAD
jgi:3-hydroxyacyl-[acyl-carrier-protein] dehydratase